MFDCFNKCKILHFIGIGGIGMSGIAEILHSLGFIVQGSDKNPSSNLERLEKFGIKIYICHDSKQVENADIVVYSSAIKQDNPELQRARELGIPCITRAEMLSQIVRCKNSIVVAGSHGKTTVTSLSATLLEVSNFNPTIINGGIINSYGSNAKLGSGDWAVIESDESDGSFVNIFPTIAIVTNIDYEHLYYYGSFENLKNAFKTFLNNLPFYGLGIVCSDDKNVKTILNNARKILTYGLEQANFQAINIRKSKDKTIFDVKHNNEIIYDIEIPILGDHNIRNALSTIALANALNIDINIAKNMLKNFTGVKKRFTKIGRINDVLAIDDYAHHPTEIRAVLSSARQYCSGKIVIVHQPHRFRRLNQLFNEFIKCFEQADIVIILPVYKADDIESAPLDATDLYNALQNKNKFFAKDNNELKYILKKIIKDLNKNDIILFTGAGNISQWANDIVTNWE